jgi:hypothetical protein
MFNGGKGASHNFRFKNFGKQLAATVLATQFLTPIPVSAILSALALFASWCRPRIVRRNMFGRRVRWAIMLVAVFTGWAAKGAGRRGPSATCSPRRKRNNPPIIRYLDEGMNRRKHIISGLSVVT